MHIDINYYKKYGIYQDIGRYQFSAYLRTSILSMGIPRHPPSSLPLGLHIPQTPRSLLWNPLRLRMDAKSV
jgi:hypothetical protein